MGYSSGANTYVGFEVSIDEFVDRSAVFHNKCGACSANRESGEKFCNECGNDLKRSVVITTLKPAVRSALERSLNPITQRAPDVDDLYDYILTNVTPVYHCECTRDQLKWGLACKVEHGAPVSKLAEYTARVAAIEAELGITARPMQFFVTLYESY